MTPFEVAFLDAPTTAADFWFIVNRVIDLIFISDMGMQFFVMYPIQEEATNSLFLATTSSAAMETSSSDPGSAHAVRYEENRRRIAKHYLSCWFWIDVASIAPSSFDFISLAEKEQTGSNGANRLKVLRFIRILRLIKLIRLLRTSRLVERYHARVSISYGTQIIIKCVIQIVLAARASLRFQLESATQSPALFQCAAGFVQRK